MENYHGLISPTEAEQFEVSQLATSGCGVTALINVLVLLQAVDQNDIPLLNWSNCILRTRAQDAPLPQYLLSRADAGCTGEELVESMTILQRDNPGKVHRPVSGLFMPYNEFIKGSGSLVDACAIHLDQGACLVATLNLQLIGNDAWHHQVIYGVDTHSKLLYCLNPACAYPETVTIKFLSTESVILIRGKDVLERYQRPGGDISIYAQERWCKYNVQQQVDRIIASAAIASEAQNVQGNKTGDSCYGKAIASDVSGDVIVHFGMGMGAAAAETALVCIPAEYVGGICIFSYSSSILER